MDVHLPPVSAAPYFKFIDNTYGDIIDKLYTQPNLTTLIYTECDDMSLPIPQRSGLIDNMPPFIERAKFDMDMVGLICHWNYLPFRFQFIKITRADVMISCDYLPANLACAIFSRRHSHINLANLPAQITYISISYHTTWPSVFLNINNTNGYHLRLLQRTNPPENPHSLLYHNKSFQHSSYIIDHAIYI